MKNQRKEKGDLRIKEWIRESVTRGKVLASPQRLSKDSTFNQNE